MMFGSDLYGYSTLGVTESADASVLSPFAALLRAPESDRVFLLDADPYDPGSAATVDVGFSQGSLSPIFGSRHWPARLLSTLNIEWNMFTGGILGRSSLPGFGSVQIAFGDGDNDDLCGYGWDGRAVAVLMGQDGWPLTDFGRLFEGTSDGATWDRSTFNLRLRDYAQLFALPLQTSRYAGTGSEEGGDDLKGRYKPLCFGYCREVEPVLVDPANLVYQVHDGVIDDVVSVSDKGLGLTRIGNISDVYTWTPVAGSYVFDRSTGLVRLGATPDGVVTADVRGEASTTYLSTAAELVEHILLTYCGLTSADLDGAGIYDLEVNSAATLNLYLTEETTRADVLDRILMSVGGWWTFTPDGYFTCGVFRFRGVAATFRDKDIFSIAREQTGVPAWRIDMGYARSWRTLTDTDLAPTVDDSVRTFTRDPLRIATVSDSAIQTRHPLAQSMTRETLLDSEAAASAEGTRILALIGADRDIYKIDVRGWQFRLRIGQTVRVTYTRFGLDKDMIIIGMTENSAGRLTTLAVWG